MLNRSKSKRKNVTKLVRSLPMEALEARRMMTATANGTGFGYDVEYSGPYGTYMPIGANGAYITSTNPGYSAFGYITVPASQFALTNGVATVNSLTLNLYNSATTGTYAPVAGNFGVYAVPNPNNRPNTDLRYGGPGSVRNSGAVDLAAIGDTEGGASDLGVDATQLVGDFSITASLPSGNTAFTFASLASGAAATIASQLNASAPVQLIVVPEYDTGSTTASTGKADWVGGQAGKYPQVLLDVNYNSNSIENISLSAATATVNKTDGTATITVNRTSTNIADAVTVNYATSDGTAIAGHDYTTTTGTLTIPINASSGTFTVPLLNPTADYGDKNFSVTLSAPTASGLGFTAALVSPTTEVVTILDGRTVDLSQNAYATATVLTTGPKVTTYFNVEGSAGGATYEDFGVADFNDGGLTYTLPSPIGTINQISLSTVNTSPVFTYVSGPLNVYVVTDTNTSIASDGSSPLIYDATNDPNEGIGTQLGTHYLLGQINFNANQPINTFTSFPLTTLSPTGVALLKTDLTNGTQFRIAVTPASSTVALSWEGIFTYNGVNEAPMIAFNYTPASTSLPAWLAAGSAATYDSGTHILNVTGTATIIADPGTDAPLVEAGAGAHLLISPATDHTVHLGALNLSGGATAVVTNTSPVVVEVASGTGNFSIDSSSQLDLKKSALEIAESSLAAGSTGLTSVTASIKSGYAGSAWTGNGIISSAAKNDTSGVTTLGVLLNNDGSGNTLFSGATFDGVTPQVNDVLVKFTYQGDATLDGVVNGSDYTRIDNGFNNHLTGWSNGDFNYDGAINGSDYTLIDNAFNTQGAALSAAPTAQVASTTTATKTKFSAQPVAATVLPASVVTGSTTSFTTSFSKDKKEIDNLEAVGL